MSNGAWSKAAVASPVATLGGGGLHLDRLVPDRPGQRSGCGDLHLGHCRGAGL